MAKTKHYVVAILNEYDHKGFSFTALEADRFSTPPEDTVCTIDLDLQKVREMLAPEVADYVKETIEQRREELNSAIERMKDFESKFLMLGGPE